MRQRSLTARAPWWPLLVLLAVLVAAVAVPVADGAQGRASKRPEPPTQRENAQAANRQGFNGAKLLGNDEIDAAGTTAVQKRVAKAWAVARRVYLGTPEDRSKLVPLDGLYQRYVRQEQRLKGGKKITDWSIAKIRVGMLAPALKWPGEDDRAQRTRVATFLAADKPRIASFWAEVAAANKNEPSDAVKAVCGLVGLGPKVMGAISGLLGRKKDPAHGRDVKQACRRAGKRVSDAASSAAKGVKDFVEDPIGTIAKGIFGPILEELQKATVYASKQVGAAMDKIATPDLGQAWLRTMLGRAGAIAVMIGLVAGILGVIHAAITANLGALGHVMARAALAGVVGSAVLTVLNIAVAFVDELSTVVMGTSPEDASKPYATLAENTAKAMADAKVPSFVALLLMLVLLVGLVVVWWELWLRAPLLYAVAFFYGPAFSASLFPPARQLLSQLNAMLAAIVVMPLVIVALLQMAAESVQGQNTITAVLQATGLILLAAASPGILLALFSPGAGLATAAGVAGAFAGTRALGRTGTKAASATLGAAGFARERMKNSSSQTGGRETGSTGGGSEPGRGPGSGGGGRGPGGGGNDPGLDPGRSENRAGSAALGGEARGPSSGGSAEPAHGRPSSGGNGGLATAREVAPPSGSGGGDRSTTDAPRPGFASPAASGLGEQHGGSSPARPAGATGSSTSSGPGAGSAPPGSPRSRQKPPARASSSRPPARPSDGDAQRAAPRLSPKQRLPAPTRSASPSPRPSRPPRGGGLGLPPQP